MGEFPIYTITRHEDYGDYIATVLTPGTHSQTEEVRPFAESASALHREVKGRFGQQAKHVKNAVFRTALEQRMVHSPEMLHLLRANAEGDLSGYYVYGSPSRPMHAAWANDIPNAVYIRADQVQVGFYTYVVSPTPIEPPVREHHNLWFVSRPPPDAADRAKQGETETNG